MGSEMKYCFLTLPLFSSILWELEIKAATPFFDTSQSLILSCGDPKYRYYCAR